MKINLNILRVEVTVSVLFFLLLLLYLKLIWPALNGPFLFDDFPNLENLAIVGGNLTLSNIGDYLASFIGSPGRPLSTLSFLINDYSWPSNPYSFKYTNVMIHLINSILLYGLVRQLAKASSKLPQSHFWPLLVMAVWMLHPLQTSAQMLVVQRMTLLSATFSFAGLWIYISLLQRAKGIKGAFAAMSALGISTILAFLCKENGALLPIYAWVLNATLLSQLLENKNTAVKQFIFITCTLSALVVLATITYMSIYATGYVVREFNLTERILSEAHVLLDYLRQIFIPRISGSGIYHDNYTVYRTLLNPISTLLIWIAILTSIALSVLYRRSWPILSFAILWFFSGHVMESTGIPLELYFEHRNYLPLLGPAIAITSLPYLLNNNRFLSFSLLGTWITLLIFITGSQAPVWGNHGLLATVWSKDSPMSLRATQELAKYQYESNQPQMAVNTLMKAYNSGLNVIDLPLASITITCWNNQVHINDDLMDKVFRDIKTTPYSNSVLDLFRQLRTLAYERQCPNLIDKNKWWLMSELLLKNPKYFKQSQDFIRIERAKAKILDRDLSGTMIELEAAYNFSPDTQISIKIAEVLISAGLYNEAEIWLQKGILQKKRWFDEITNNDKEYARTLLKAIQSKKMQPQ